MTQNYLERLNFVLGDRKITPWGAGIGLNKGTIGRINQGHVPGHQILNLIQRVENVSIGWLVDGSGEPFLVHREDSDAAMADYLQALFDEPGWNAYLLTDLHMPAIALLQPGEIDFKGKSVRYQVTEIVTGPLGPLTLETFNRYQGLRRLVKLSGGDMDAINQGRVGSYRLGQWIEGAHSLDGGALEFSDVVADYAVAENTGNYGDDVRALLEGYRQLSPHNQESIHMIIEALLIAQAENVHNLDAPGYGVQSLSERIGRAVVKQRKKS